MVAYTRNPGTEKYQQLETSLGYAVYSGAPLRGRGTEREREREEGREIT